MTRAAETVLAWNGVLSPSVAFQGWWSIRRIVLAGEVWLDVLTREVLSPLGPAGTPPALHARSSPGQ